MKKIITIIICVFISLSMFGKNYTISKDGITMIKDFEKCALTAYRDAGGWSIGYGHHTKDVKEGMSILIDDTLEAAVLIRQIHGVLQVVQEQVRSDNRNKLSVMINGK